MYKTGAKFKNIFILIMLAVCFFTLNVYADSVKVIIDGEQKNFTTEPIVINDRVMLPIRDTFEAVGATVEWNDETYTATATKGEKTVTVKPESYELDINGEKLVMDVAAIEREDRIFIPVRFAAQAFDCSVTWNENSNTVNIYTLNDFEFYPEANVPVFSDVVSSASLVSEEATQDGETAYTYNTVYEDITEYFMVLQKHFGFVPYSLDFDENGGTIHVYVNTESKDVASVTCKDGESGYVAIVTPTSYDENRKQEQSPEQSAPPTVETLPQPDAEIQPPAEETPSDSVDYYENTENTLPTYTSITGVNLVEKVTEDDMDVYKYTDSFIGMMQYTMAIEFYGYREYNIDIDFGKITRYYSNGDKTIGIASSMMTNEVWIIIPHN